MSPFGEKSSHDQISTSSIVKSIHATIYSKSLMRMSTTVVTDYIRPSLDTRRPHDRHLQIEFTYDRVGSPQPHSQQ